MKSHSISWCLFLLTFLLGCSNMADDQHRESQTEGKENEVVTKKTILFFGNSLTAGFGLDEEEAFPALIQDKIDSLELEYKVINGGLSGETTASGLSRISWFLEESIDVFFLELGGNDGLRGIDIEETERNLRAILNTVKDAYPEAQLILAGMEIPPNMGPGYTQSFREMYPKIADDYNDLIFIPFLLEGVGGNPELNLPDGIHPTAEGHIIVAENIWPYLKKALGYL